MSKKKYIPDNSWLTCDKGANPIKIKVTHNNNSYIYGEKLVSEMDMIPGENIDSFGSCSLCGSCVFDPVYWDKCNQGVKVNSYKLVFEDANLLCKKGGKIRVDFTVPSHVSGASIGLGVGIGLGLNGFNAVAPNLKGVDALMPVNQLRWSQNTVSPFFRDGRSLSVTRDIIMRNGSAYGQIPPLEVVKMSDGGFTTLDHRRGVASLEAGAKEVPVKIIEGKTPLPPDEVARFEIKPKAAKKLGVDVTYKPTTYEDAIRVRSANQGASFPLEGSTTPPRITGEGIGSAPKANSFIQNTRNSLANTNMVKSINSSSTTLKINSYLAKNSETISKVGKVAGRGAIVVGVALESYNVYTTYQQEGEFGTETKKATGGAVGSLAGAWAGAEAGAAVGSFIGSVVPGAGTLAGGIVGGIIGGAIGGIAGSSVGKWIGSWF